MNRQEYIAELTRLLADLPEPERSDAVHYYEEYFDAAGPGAEQATIGELGSPQSLAEKIRRGTGTPPPPRAGAVAHEAQARCLHMELGRAALYLSTDPTADAVRVEARGVRAGSYHVWEGEGALHVRLDGMLPGQDMLWGTPEIDVTLPGLPLEEVRIHLAAGDLRTTGPVHANTFEAQLRMGFAEIDRLQAGCLRLHTAMGRLHAKVLQAGNARLYNAMGDITVGTLRANRAELECAMGAVRANRIEGARRIDAKSTMGDVALALVGRCEEYECTGHCTMGTLQCNARQAAVGGVAGQSRLRLNTGAPRRVCVCCRMGNARLDFLEE